MFIYNVLNKCMGIARNLRNIILVFHELTLRRAFSLGTYAYLFFNNRSPFSKFCPTYLKKSVGLLICDGRMLLHTSGFDRPAVKIC